MTFKNIKKINHAFWKNSQKMFKIVYKQPYIKYNP